MSSHILAEVSRLAGRVGVIHKGNLLQEWNTDELERNRKRRLILRTRDIESAHRTLIAAGQPAEILQDGTIELKNVSSIEHPDDINSILVNAGTPPTQLMVEEEELEQYFLRLVGMDGGLQNG
jgi:ABC-2 type transport system ATP-binding protein